MPRVAAVSSSPVHGFSKQPRPFVRLLAGLGVEGDAHCGATVQHLYWKRRDPTAPNPGQVHLFAAEMLLEVQTKGFAVMAGELGENILTQGVDLLGLPEGTLLHLGGAAVLEVTGLRTPCRKIDDFRSGLQQHLWGAPASSGPRARRAGIMSVVRVGGEVGSGDRIDVVLPAQPWRPLRPL